MGDAATRVAFCPYVAADPVEETRVPTTFFARPGSRRYGVCHRPSERGQFRAETFRGWRLGTGATSRGPLKQRARQLASDHGLR